MAGTRLKRKATLQRRDLVRLRIAVDPSTEDAVGWLLESEFGQPASIYTDARQNRSWATVYLARRSEWNPARKARLLKGLRDLKAFGLPIPRVHVAASAVPGEDWAESWKRHFKPLVIGRKLVVLPSWSRRQPKPGQALVILDPGLSFGTGNHPTTRFCLEELASARSGSGKRSLLDVGCGSGILAIAAVKLGYDNVLAFDFDPAAVRVARENAAQNNVTRGLRLQQADISALPLRPDQSYDVVCANLTADLLIQHAAKLGRRVAPSGRLALAGILKSQFAEVVAAFRRQGFQLGRARVVREWHSGSFSRG